MIGLDTAKMVCSQRANSAWPGEANCFCRTAECGWALTACCPRLVTLFW